MESRPIIIPILATLAYISGLTLVCGVFFVVHSIFLRPEHLGHSYILLGSSFGSCLLSWALATALEMLWEIKATATGHRISKAVSKSAPPKVGRWTTTYTPPQEDPPAAG